MLHFSHMGNNLDEYIDDIRDPVPQRPIYREITAKEPAELSQSEALRDIESIVRNYRGRYKLYILKYQELSKESRKGKTSALSSRIEKWYNALESIERGKTLMLTEDERYAVLDVGQARSDLKMAAENLQLFLNRKLLDITNFTELKEGLEFAERNYIHTYRALKRKNFSSLVSERSRK